MGSPQISKLLAGKGMCPTPGDDISDQGIDKNRVIENGTKMKVGERSGYSNVVCHKHDKTVSGRGSFVI